LRTPDPGTRSIPTIAVILAGGTGQRIGLKVPKQLLKISGKPVIQHAINAFDKSPLIDEILVLMTPGFVAEAEKIISNCHLTTPTRVIEGGPSRSETTRRAIAALGQAECNVLLHDAVRPLVDQRIIDDCVRALRDYPAVDVAIPSSDTIIMVDQIADVEVISDIPDRSRLRRGQTPQAFRLSVLRRAYELAASDPAFTTTDDCGVVRRYLPDVPIRVVEGTEHNMKITHPIDVYLADKLFRLASHIAPEHASTETYENQLAGRTAVIFGGSCGIGRAIGDLLRSFGATVFPFSRSLTGTHVENPEHVAAALAKAHRETGRIDFVVNTAGILRIGKLAELDETSIEEALRVNYLAPVQIARASLPYLQETSGSLLLFTSSSYTRGRADYSLYSSSKAAVVNLTQALADEWSTADVRVNCINPERTATPMRTRAFGEEPADTLLTAAAVAETSVDVLISGITGHIVDIRRGAEREQSSGLGPIAAAVLDAEAELEERTVGSDA